MATMGEASMNAKLDATLMAAMSAPVFPPDQHARLDPRVQQTLRMIESGAAYHIRDLAAQIRLSPSHLQRLFKQETGICIGEWLSEQRLQKAAYLLATSYMSLKEIAHLVGYEHSSSFIRAFERRFTQAPTSYRARGDMIAVASGANAA